MEWVTIKELSRILSVSEKTIRRRIKSGEFEVKEEYIPHEKGATKTFFVKFSGGQSNSQMDISGGQSNSQMDISGGQSNSQMDISGGQSNVMSNKINNLDTNSQVDKIKTNKPQVDKVDFLVSGGQTGQVGQNDKETQNLASVQRENKNGDFGESVKIEKSVENPNGVQVENLPAPVADADSGHLETGHALSLLNKEQKEFEKRSLDDREKAWAKLGIVKEYRNYKEYCKKTGVALMQANQSFEIKVNDKKLCQDEMKKLNLISISYKTIARWDKAHRESGDIDYPISLCEHRKGNAGRSKILTKPLRNRIKEMAKLPLESTKLYRLLEGELKKVGEDLPISLRTFSEVVSKARKDIMIKTQGKGKKYKDELRPHVHRINNALPGDIWESDGHNMNNLVKSPFYAHKPEIRVLIRPIILAWVDVATGYVAGWVLCVAENPNAVRTSLYYGIKNAGLPVSLRMDNGSAYKNVDHCPHMFAGDGRNTPRRQKARLMLERNNNGLYKSLGLNYNFTIAGNSESKMVEAFWKYCISTFEGLWPVWIGNKIENRPEEYRLPNTVLLKKFGDKIPTWEEYTAMLERYINDWNKTARPILKNAFGEDISPESAYFQIEHKKYSDAELISLIRDPYPQQATIFRGEIMVNGIYYSHPLFMALNNKKVNFYYDESDFSELTIAGLDGEIFSQKAKMVKPGLQVGDDMLALKDTRHREKEGKLAYLATMDCDGNIAKMNKALEQTTNDMIWKQEKLMEQQKNDGSTNIKLLSGNKISSKRKNISIEDKYEITDEQYEELMRKRDEFNKKLAEEEANKDDGFCDLEPKKSEEKEPEYDYDEVVRRLGWK